MAATLSYIFYDKESLQLALSDWMTDSNSAQLVYGHINSWNVSLITDMSFLFSWYYSDPRYQSFNDDISDWDTSRVTNMRKMFDGASSFNQDLSRWKTSKVSDFSYDFYLAAGFNQDVSTWDTSRAKDMSGMFSKAVAINCNLSLWDTSQVTDMSNMFFQANMFNGDISSWDTSLVTNMNSMFSSAYNFNQDISGWNTSLVTNMNSMFAFASSFNLAISFWNTSRVIDMGSMFAYASSFNENLSQWDTSHVANMEEMFTASSFNNNISDWDTSKVTSMIRMFRSASSFNHEVSRWDTSLVTSMMQMFQTASSFNQNISFWNTSQVSDLRFMFQSASSFNQGLGSWYTSKVTSMTGMFANASSFNNDLSRWDTAQVLDMSNMFDRALAFNHNILNWQTSKVTQMIHMFDNALAFNNPISLWDTSNVTDMSSMFNNAKSFNQAISSWSTTQVTDMRYMFATADNFNQVIAEWDTSNVSDMRGMFRAAFSFNQDISRWNTSRVTSMNEMFFSASSFDQDLCWKITPEADVSDMFRGSRAELLPFPNCTVRKPTVKPTLRPSTRPTTKPVIAVGVTTKPRVGAIVGGIAGGTLGVVASIVYLYIAFGQRKKRGNTGQKRLTTKEGFLVRRKNAKLIKDARKVLLTSILSNESSTDNKVPICYVEYITEGWENILGSGGFGSVYKGVDNEANIEVAIKTLRSDRKSQKYQIQFEEEINRLKDVQHPNIVRIFATCFEPGFYCMILEFAAGGTVESILWLNTTRKLFSSTSRLYVAQCLVAAVQHLHKKSILHRDIKPDNLCMLHENWFDNPHAILIDLGIATHVRDEERLGLTMTSNPGTKYFMAPEYMERFHFDAKSDVFSLGVTLICMLTADYSIIPDAVDCKPVVLIENADYLGGHWPRDVLTDFASLIGRCTASNPKDRPTIEILFEGLSALRKRNGDLDRLPLDISRRINTHTSASPCTNNLPVVDTSMKCVVCGLVNQGGLVCSKQHFTCYRDTCLEVIAREYIGCEKICCPGKCCSESFYLRDLFGKINADVYGDLVFALDRINVYKYFVDAVKRKLVCLNQVLNDLVKKNEALVSMHVDVADLDLFSEQSHNDSILSIKAVANMVEEEELRLQFERQSIENRLKYGIDRGHSDDRYNELDGIIQKQEYCKLHHAESLNLLSQGRLQCPQIFVLLPVSCSSIKESRFRLHSTYRMYFLCSHDYSWVETAITLKQPKAWFCKVASLVRLSTTILRLLCAAIPGTLRPPKNMTDLSLLTGFRRDSIEDDILEHMEFVLHQLDGGLEDVKKRLDSCFCSEDIMELIHEFNIASSREAYGAMAMQVHKTGNSAWLDEMELLHDGTEFAWVKRENAKAWRRARTSSTKQKKTVSANDTVG